MSKLKVGIVGVGNIAGFHRAGYLKAKDVEIAAICDINEDRLKARGKEWEIEHLYNNVYDMLRNEQLDAVSICTWNCAHAECSIAALEAGVNVICEKPMAMNAEEAVKMHEAAQKNGKLLMIGFVRRFGKDCVVLKDFIDRGDFGDIYYAKASYLRRNGCPGGWFGEKAKSGGGPLIDLGVHVIDMTRYLMGNPKPVSVYGATFQKLYDRKNIKSSVGGYTSADKGNESVFDVEDLAVAFVRYDNGAVLMIDTSFSLNIKNDNGDIELFGTKSGAKIAPHIEMYTENNGYMTNVNLAMPTALDFEGLFEAELNHFVECVRTGSECRTPSCDGVEIMKILDAIYESSKTGHEVLL